MAKVLKPDTTGLWSRLRNDHVAGNRLPEVASHSSSIPNGASPFFQFSSSAEWISLDSTNGRCYKDQCWRGVSWSIGVFFFIGIVAQNSSGECIWWCRKKLVGRLRPVEGEALAIFHGISVACDKCWAKVKIESDYLQAITCLTNSVRSSTYGAIIDSCSEFRQFLSNFLFTLFVDQATC